MSDQINDNLQLTEKISDTQYRIKHMKSGNHTKKFNLYKAHALIKFLVFTLKVLKHIRLFSLLKH